MRKALAAVAVLAAAGCRQGSPPPAATADEAVEWSIRSPDDRFEVSQVRSANGCRVKALVRPGDRSLWTTSTCVATQSALVFVSPDGERLLVLDLFPSHQDADWSNVPLVTSWSLGAAVRRYTGAEILPARRVTDMRHTLSWVRGRTFDEVRAAARTSPDGTQLSIDLVDGGTLTLAFDGAPLPAPRDLQPAPAAASEPARASPAGDEPELTVETAPVPAPVREASAGDEQGLYRWEDEAGQLHFGSGAQVPTKYRRRAQPVSGSVGVIPLDHAAPSAAGTPAAGQQAPAAAAAGGAQPAPGTPAPGAPPPPDRAPDPRRER